MSRNIKAVLVAFPVILILFAIAIQNFIPTRATLATNACANNLSWLQRAKAQWARELNKPDTAVPSEDDLRPVLKAIGAGAIYLRCPSGGIYSIGAVSQPVTCSVREQGHTLPADWNR